MSQPQFSYEPGVIDAGGYVVDYGRGYIAGITRRYYKRPMGESALAFEARMTGKVRGLKRYTRRYQRIARLRAEGRA